MSGADFEVRKLEVFADALRQAFKSGQPRPRARPLTPAEARREWRAILAMGHVDVVGVFRRYQASLLRDGGGR